MITAIFGYNDIVVVVKNRSGMRGYNLLCS